MGLWKWLKEDGNRFVSEQVIVVFCKNAISYVDLVGIYDLRNVGNYGKIMIVELEWIEIEIIEGSFDFKDLNTILWI